MKILGIETSCDETAAAVVEDGQTILSNVVVSQVDLFAAYGGVIPEIAARSHLETIQPVIEKALKDANLTWDDIDAISVTHTPGLLGSLLIGTLTARTLAILHNKPLYPIHHLKSHIYANWLGDAGKAGAEIISFQDTKPSEPESFLSTVPENEPQSLPSRALSDESVVKTTAREDGRLEKRFLSTPAFPLLALVISGGHTQIIRMTKHNNFEVIGTTLDDAVGECFDKVAKILGLLYPGGPAIAESAKTGNPQKYPLPHPKVKNLDFSFSGLKTAVLRAVQNELNLPISHPSQDIKNHLTPQQVSDFAASFQNTAVDILLAKLKDALKNYPDTKSLVFAGGVSANELLRKKATKLPAFFPDKSLSGDNAAMVAAAAFFEIKTGVQPTDPYHLDISPRSAIS